MSSDVVHERVEVRRDGRQAAYVTRCLTKAASYAATARPDEVTCAACLEARTGDPASTAP